MPPTTPVPHACSEACRLGRTVASGLLGTTAAPLASDDPLGPRIGHVELVRLACDRAGLQVAAFVAADGLDLAGIAGGEDLVGIVQFGRSDRALLHPHAGIAQERDGAKAGDAGKEAAVGD